MEDGNDLALGDAATAREFGRRTGEHEGGVGVGSAQDLK